MQLLWCALLVQNNLHTGGGRWWSTYKPLSIPKVEKVNKVAAKKPFLLFDVWSKQDAANSTGHLGKVLKRGWWDIIWTPSQDTQHVTRGQPSKENKQLVHKWTTTPFVKHIKGSIWCPDKESCYSCKVPSSYCQQETLRYYKMALVEIRNSMVKWKILGYIPPVQCCTKSFWTSVVQQKQKQSILARTAFVSAAAATKSDGGTVRGADEVGQRWRFSCCGVWQQTFDTNIGHPQSPERLFPWQPTRSLYHKHTHTYLYWYTYECHSSLCSLLNTWPKLNPLHALLNPPHLSPMKCRLLAALHLCHDLKLLF